MNGSDDQRRIQLSTNRLETSASRKLNTIHRRQCYTSTKQHLKIGNTCYNKRSFTSNIFRFIQWISVVILTAINERVGYIKALSLGSFWNVEPSVAAPSCIPLIIRASFVVVQITDTPTLYDIIILFERAVVLLDPRRLWRYFDRLNF